MPIQTHHPIVLLTGATGFVGHYLLAKLLEQECRCAVLLRSPLRESQERLRLLLADLNVDLDRQIASGQVIPIEGDLCSELPDVGELQCETIIHAAASTQFDRDGRGEPARTNIDGTARLLRWISQWPVKHFHHVSTAYASGRYDGSIPEKLHEGPREFRNEYERSKWQAERLCQQWAKEAGTSLTIHRPSIIIGAYETGRASKFDGLYLSARATEVFSRMYDADDPARHALSLRLRGRADDCQNLVPVDYVASMIAAAVVRPQMCGRVYHLVHPNPPTNQNISDALNTYFDVHGSHWVSPESFDEMTLSEHERIFNDFSKPISHYFTDTPKFQRDHTAELENATGLSCGIIDAAAIARLMRHAQSCHWGKKRRSSSVAKVKCSDYFEKFLPLNVVRSQVAKLTGLSVIVRFIIEDEANGQWVCRFERGLLAEVHRGANTLSEDFGYRLTRDVFWQAVNGKVHPQHAFLMGQVHLFGDIERALKMAMILHAFNQEFPFDQGGRQCLLHAS